MSFLEETMRNTIIVPFGKKPLMAEETFFSTISLDGRLAVVEHQCRAGILTPRRENRWSDAHESETSSSVGEYSGMFFNSIRFPFLLFSFKKENKHEMKFFFLLEINEITVIGARQ